VPGAQDARRPCVVALEYSRGGQRHQRIHKGELVLQIPDFCESVAHRGNRLVSVPTLCRNDRAYSQGARQEPRASVPEGYGRVIEQTLRLIRVAARQRDACETEQAVPGAPWDRQRFELLDVVRPPVPAGAHL